MNKERVYVGIDVAKADLDISIENEKRRLSNNSAGHRELVKWLKQIEIEVWVICEASGGYERALLQALHRAQLKVSLVQASRARQFARAAGILAKTDPIHATSPRALANA